jgi:very-short-patch-repair endonuclease
MSHRAPVHQCTCAPEHQSISASINSPPLLGRGQGRGMKKALTPVARRLRSQPTEAERHLWHVLRYKSLGVKFRRQAVIGRYIVDFVCFERRLIIEVDGGQHSQDRKDIFRDDWLRSRGFVVLRFWNNEVLGNLDGVFNRIEDHLKSPSLALPTRGREYLLARRS